MVKMELPKLKDFLEEAKKLIEVAKEAMRKQFDRKRYNPQGLKVGDNMWLKAKNIQSNQPSKKLDQKRYKSFRILKNIS